MLGAPASAFSAVFPSPLRDHALSALSDRVQFYVLGMMVAIGGIGEGFVSRLGAQGLLVYF